MRCVKRKSSPSSNKPVDSASAVLITATCGATCEDWQNRVASRLPGGTSTVTVDGATGVVTIEIRWTAPGEATNRFTTATTIVNS